MGRIKELLIDRYEQIPDKIRADYFQWLCDLAGVERSGQSYWFLFKDLHSIEFFAILERDNNRGEDGKKLREEYLEETCCGSIPMRGPCTVLEMMVAMARRMDDIMYDNQYGSRLQHWFWKLIENLGLEDCGDGEEYVALNRKRDVQDTIYIMLERKYTKWGHGGLFPLPTTKGYIPDQRKVELWYQMQRWLQEEM